MLRLVQAETAEQIALARELMLEYASWLNFDLCFQGFEEELRTLPGKYSPPKGRLLLGFCDDQLCGMVAMRPLAQLGVCEMKRLFVRPAFRGKSLGRELAEAIIHEGAQAGYKKMRLDTVPGKMDQAIKIYRELGFQLIAPYYESPVQGTLFLELDLEDRIRISP